MTCAKTQGFLAKHKVAVSEERDAKKSTIKGDAALAVLKDVDEVYAAKGKQVVHLDLKHGKPSKADLLAVLLGPTGNLRAPTLRTARVAVHRGGAPTMTPDGRPVLGRMPGLEGFYVASGCCVGGLSLSPAAGRALADLILDGASDPDLTPLSVERFRGRYEDPSELTAACVGQYVRKYTH